MQGEVTENQRDMITANWGKLNLSRQGVAKAKQSMIAALNAACSGDGSTMHHLSSRAATTSLAAEQVKAALVVSHPPPSQLCTDPTTNAPPCPPPGGLQSLARFLGCFWVQI